MAFSYRPYPGDGTARSFAVPFPYLSRKHVNATVDGVPATFTWTSPGLIELDAAPRAGTIVEVRRTTPRDTVLVDFNDGSTLTETDLDTATLQLFFMAQEAYDAAGTVSAASYRVDDLSPFMDGERVTFALKRLTSSMTTLLEGEGLWIVSLNGLAQKEFEAFSVNKAASTVTFAEPPQLGDTLVMTYMRFYRDSSGSGSGGGGGPGGGNEGGSGSPQDPTEYPPIVVGEEPPEDPVEGQVWFDTGTMKIKIYTCEGDPPACRWEEYDWFPVIPPTNVVVGTAPPANPVEGMIWFDQSAGLIKIYTNGAWVSYDWKPAIPPSGVTVGAATPATALEGAVHFNTNDNQIYFRISGEWVAYAWGVTGVAEILTVVNAADLPSNASVGQIAFVRNEDKLYVRGEGGWTSNFASAGLGAGSVTTNLLAANAVVAEKIAAGAITTVKLAANVITAEKVAAGAISAIHMQAGSVTADKIAASAITADKIGASVITGDKVAAFAIGANQLAANAITAEKIAAGAITANKIAAAAITGDKLAVSTIHANRIQTNTLILGTTNLTQGAVSQVQWVKGGDTPVTASAKTILTTNMVCTPGATRIIEVVYTHADDASGVPNDGKAFGSIANLYIGGSKVTGSDITVAYGTGGHVFKYVDTASRSGSVSFSFDCRGNASPAKTTTVRNPVLIIQELKR